jgi:hypothetical protein
MTIERDFDKNPYSPDEEKVAKWLVERSGGNVGGGEDPIGFLMVSYDYLVHQRNQIAEACKRYNDGLINDAHKTIGAIESILDGSNFT